MTEVQKIVDQIKTSDDGNQVQKVEEFVQTDFIQFLDESESLKIHFGAQVDFLAEEAKSCTESRLLEIEEKLL